MGYMNRFGLQLAALMFSFACYAGEIEVDSTWLRATAPGQDAAGLDLSITSKRAATLVGVSSPVAKTVELHGMTHDKGMMKMREIKAIELPAGKRVNLRNSGYHLMLNGLKAPLKAGDSVPLTLNIKVASDPVMKIETSVEVQPLTARQPDDHQHGH